jgi:EAL domain-containing protein (putative c-di-GMP-specific phosphodiesterase class I)
MRISPCTGLKRGTTRPTSSLTRRCMPASSVNGLKIDRSFINGLTIDGRNNDVILSIMSLANSLNFEVIAEGVEREHHLRSIKDLQCQYGQGHLFAAPMEQGELEGWLRNEHVHASAF